MNIIDHKRRELIVCRATHKTGSPIWQETAANEATFMPGTLRAEAIAWLLQITPVAASGPATAQAFFNEIFLPRLKSGTANAGQLLKNGVNGVRRATSNEE